jgi:hypothetical protein
METDATMKGIFMMEFVKGQPSVSTGTGKRDCKKIRNTNNNQATGRLEDEEHIGKRWITYGNAVFTTQDPLS